MQPFNAPVAQLDRVIGFEPIGREFESLRAHHIKQKGPPFLVGLLFGVCSESNLLLGIAQQQPSTSLLTFTFFHLCLIADNSIASSALGAQQGLRSALAEFFGTFAFVKMSHAD